MHSQIEGILLDKMIKDEIEKNIISLIARIFREKSTTKCLWHPISKIYIIYYDVWRVSCVIPVRIMTRYELEGPILKHYQYQTKVIFAIGLITG